MHTYIICIGSNYNRKENLFLARKQLMVLFPDIRFAREQETKPFLLHNPALFSNQVAMFHTAMDIDTVTALHKQIEKQAGRTLQDVKQEKIALDIDIVKYDDAVVKDKDLTRYYIVDGINELMNKTTDTMKFIGIIPARYASTRFPAKPLALLGGKPIIRRVYEQVADFFDEVYVATDDERIEEAVKSFGGKVIMTSPDHNSGSDRCYEAYCKIGGEFDVVVNIQGDEPFIQPSQLITLKECFNDSSIHIATLVKPFTNENTFADLENINSPKVVVDKNMNALYFSRSIIPFQRNVEKEDWISNHVYYKHIGLYAYKTNVLKEITSLPKSSLEAAESLEQLRWLENGYKIKVGLTDIETIGIDTPEDLQRAEEYLKQSTL